MEQDAYVKLKLDLETKIEKNNQGLKLYTDCLTTFTLIQVQYFNFLAHLYSGARHYCEGKWWVAGGVCAYFI